MSHAVFMRHFDNVEWRRTIERFFTLVKMHWFRHDSPQLRKRQRV